MKVEIWFEAPDSQVLDLNEDQAELWIKYSELIEESRELRRTKGWTQETLDQYHKVDLAYEEFTDSIAFDLEYPDLEVDEITEW